MILRPKTITPSATDPQDEFYENGDAVRVHVTKAHAARICPNPWIHELPMTHELYRLGHRYYWEVEDARGYYKHRISCIVGFRNYIGGLKLKLEDLHHAKG